MFITYPQSHPPPLGRDYAQPPRGGGWDYAPMATPKRMSRRGSPLGIPTCYYPTHVHQSTRLPLRIPTPQWGTHSSAPSTKSTWSPIYQSTIL
jgi:hypothetical protein